MKVYLTYFKLKFITGLQYRAAAYAGISTQFFFGFVFIMVYFAFYKSGSGHLPMEMSALASYLWLNQAFFALVTNFYKDNEIYNMIKTGNISYELIRPKNLFYMWYFKILGQRYSNVLLRSMPIIVITLLLPKPIGLSLPVSLNAFILSIVSLFIGSLLIIALSTLYPIITLFTMNEKGVVNIFVVIADLLSGLVVPIPFFPPFLKLISKFLPFQYVSDLPFRIYVGNINIQNGLIGLGIQVIWIFIIILIGYKLMNYNLKRVVVQGG